MSLNRVYLVGNLGQDPKSGTTKNGHLWCNATLATQKKKKDAYETTWVSITAWNKQAETLASCKKGDSVFIDGELYNNSYEKDGQKIVQTKVVASFIQRAVMKSCGEELIGPEYGDDNEGL